MKFFIQNYNNVLSDLIQYVQTSGKHSTTGKMAEADVIVLWSDVGDWDRMVIQSARSTGKKVYVIQHGRKGSSRYYPPFNEPIVADKLLVWGQNDKDLLVKHGHPAKKIEVVGTTIFDHLIPRQKHEGYNILFSPEHWGVEVEENRVVAGWLKRVSHHLNVTSKILPEHDGKLYPNPIYSDRNDEKHFEVLSKLLSTTDLVVGISESTLELLAQSLDIPVIIADIWEPKAGANGDKRYKDYLRTYSNACTKVKNENEFQEAIKAYVEHPELLREERKQICILEGGINIKDPIKEIMRWIS